MATRYAAIRSRASSAATIAMPAISATMSLTPITRPSGQRRSASWRPCDLGGYAAFIPVGRTFDPDNNWDWEGVGVAPDVAAPADQALDEALRRLGVTPAQRRPLTVAAAA